MPNGATGLAQLGNLGKIAGIGGIAVGFLALVVPSLISTIPGLPPEQQAGALGLIAIGCFGIGALGLVVWLASGLAKRRSVSTSGDQSPGIISESGVEVTYRHSPDDRTGGVPKASAKAANLPKASATTESSESPAIIAGGSAGVRYASDPAKPPRKPVKR